MFGFQSSANTSRASCSVGAAARVEVERGRGRRHHVEAQGRRHAQIPSVSEVSSGRSASSLSAAVWALTDKKTTS